MRQIPLQADLGIECLAELQAALQAHLDEEGPLALSGDRVERVHAAGLQLLHAFVRDRAASGRRTTVTAASPTLAAAAHQLALASSLGVGSDAGPADPGANAGSVPATAVSSDTPDLPSVAEEGNPMASDDAERHPPTGAPE